MLEEEEDGFENELLLSCDKIEKRIAKIKRLPPIQSETKSNEDRLSQLSLDEKTKSDENKELELVQSIRANHTEDNVFSHPSVVRDDSFDLKMIQSVNKIDADYVKKRNLKGMESENIKYTDSENVSHSVSKSEHTQTPLIERILLKTPKSSISDQSSRSTGSSVAKSLKRNLSDLFCNVDDEDAKASPIKMKRQKIESSHNNFQYDEEWDESFIAAIDRRLQQ